MQRRLFVVVAAFVVLQPVVASAQRTVQVDELADSVFLTPDRRVLGQMIKARELLKQERYGEAVAKLGRLLKDREDGGPIEDYFFQPDRRETPEIHRSLKCEAQTLIGQMPAEGLHQYEMQFGSEARRILNEAVASGDRANLAKVVRCYFHTKAGREATLLMGLYHLDHTEPLAGALTLQRLRDAMGNTRPFEPTLSLAIATCWLRAGMRDKASQALLTLRKQHPEIVIELGGGDSTRLDGQPKGPDWLVQIVGTQAPIGRKSLDSWTMFRGNPARNAATVGSTPLLNLRWKIPLAEDNSLVKNLLEQRRQHYEKQGFVILPGLHPLAIDNVVLMRTYRNLLAIEFDTGKRLWEVSVDHPTENVLGSSAGGVTLQQSPHLADALARRMWQDATYGTLSSDGRFVFSIEDLPLQTRATSSRTVIINNRRVNASTNRPYNRLAAYNIQTGKVRWQLGGRDDPQAIRILPEANTFFLGPPLPLMDRLYVMGETEGEIRLMALDPSPEKRGKLIWEQKLATTQQTVLTDPMRRMAGVSPSYADGILVCPTSVGAVVAVDLASRSLVWGYRYSQRNDRFRRSQPFVAPFTPYSFRQFQQRWADAGATIARGRVLLTPVESNDLHCLDLQTGELLWKQPRADNLYLAHVHEDKVVVVGRRGVEAYSLSETIEVEEAAETIKPDPFSAIPPAAAGKDDETNEPKKVIRPKPLWDGRVVEFPEGAVPSGRGFFSDGRYFVPLSTAEVVAVDLKAGKITHRSKSRAGIVPGNLICYKGQIISHGCENVEAFYQLESARKEAASGLAANPADPDALRLSGEILLDEGKYSEAIASFRKAFEADKKTQSHDMPRSRDLLRDAMMDGLQVDFDAHRNLAKEIKPLLDTPEQRAQYLRLMAMGLKQAGEWQAALDHYLELADLDPDKYPLDSITKSHMVRRDRWIQTELASLRDVADAALFDKQIEERLKAAMAKADVKSLKRFLDYFGNHPTAGEVRRRLAEKLIEADHLLEAEMVLWQDYNSSDPSLAGFATAKLAEMLRKTERNEDAAVCYQRLAGEFSEVVCYGQQTGQELLDALPDADPVRSFLSREDPWPRGKVRNRTDSSKSSNYSRFTMSLRGDPSPFFRETTLQFDRSGYQVKGFDTFGRTRWQVSLATPGSSHSIPGFHRSITHGLACGHLLLISMGHRIGAVDILGDSGKSPKLLWNKDPTDARLDAIRLGRVPIILPNRFGRMPNLAGYRQTSLLGPVTSRYVCFQRFRNLVAIDPLSGEPLWIQDDIEPASTLFGNDQFIFVLPPEKDVAIVFRASDGKLLGERKVPRSKQIDNHVAANFIPFRHSSITTIGTSVLFWEENQPNPVLRLFDVWNQKDAWPSRKFATGAKICMMGHKAAGVLEPSGRFVLISLSDGQTRFEAKLEPEKDLTEFFVFRSGDGYALVTHAPTTDKPSKPVEIRAISTMSSKPIMSGRVYMFDAQGGKVWPKPFELKNQCLLLDQPSRLPILIFACLESKPTETGSPRYELAIVCIDKRTGLVAYKRRTFTSTSLLSIAGDPEKKTVDIALNRNAIHLTFTDDSSPGPTAAEGLLKAFQRVVEEKVIEELLKGIGN